MIPYVLQGITVGRIVMIGDATEYEATAYVTSSNALSDYAEAIYSRARSGTIVVKTDGHTYDVLYSD